MARNRRRFCWGNRSVPQMRRKQQKSALCWISSNTGYSHNAPFCGDVTRSDLISLFSPIATPSFFPQNRMLSRIDVRREEKRLHNMSDHTPRQQGRAQSLGTSGHFTAGELLRNRSPITGVELPNGTCAGFRSVVSSKIATRNSHLMIDFYWVLG